MSLILEPSSIRLSSVAEMAQLELALVTVQATGGVQDLASEIVSLAGGRLMSLGEAGFTAQVTNRPEAIDAMIAELDGVAPIEVVRSGSLSVPKI